MPEPSPVGAQRFKQRRTHHHVPVLATLATAGGNHHPLAFNVAHLQRGDLRPACPYRIQRHHQDGLKRGLGRINQTCDFLLSEDLGQVQHLLGVERLGRAPTALEHLNLKIPQCCQPLCDRVRRQLSGAEHCLLILPDVLPAKLIGGTMEVPGIMLYRADVIANGGRA